VNPAQRATIELACRYGAAGVAVFPVIGKAPATTNGFLDASTERSEIVQMFSRAARRGGALGIGGYLAAAGLYAVDLDTKDGIDGPGNFAELEQRHGEPIARSVVSTTPSGGQHIWLRMGGHRVGSSAGKLAPNVDVRGDGGYIVLPGSPGYEFLDGRDFLDGAEPGLGADWLADLAPSHGETASNGGKASTLDRSTLGPQNLAMLEALERLGGHSAYMVGAEIRLTRPGKVSGASATIGHIAPGVAKIFTPNWPPFSDGQIVELDLDGNIHGLPANDVEDAPASDLEWTLVDLAALIDGDEDPILPTLWLRDDGQGLFYRGAINELHGDSGDGKSLALSALAAEEIAAGRHVVWIDHEAAFRVLKMRLLEMGVSRAQMHEYLHWTRPQEPANARRIERLIDQLAPFGQATVVVDSVGESLGLHGLHENDDLDFVRWKLLLPQPLELAGHTVVLVDHGTKARDNMLYPSGSKRKRAAISGSAYLAEQTVAFDRTTPGKIRLTCAKDRHGNYAHGKAAAIVQVVPATQGQGDLLDQRGLLTLTVEAPTRTDIPRPASSVEYRAEWLDIVVEAVRLAGSKGLTSRPLCEAVRRKLPGGKGDEKAIHATAYEASLRGLIQRPPADPERPTQGRPWTYLGDLDEL
jgi:hypothetical protein